MKNILLTFRAACRKTGADKEKIALFLYKKHEKVCKAKICS